MSAALLRRNRKIGSCGGRIGLWIEGVIPLPYHAFFYLNNLHFALTTDTLNARYSYIMNSWNQDSRKFWIPTLFIFLCHNSHWLSSGHVWLASPARWRAYTYEPNRCETVQAEPNRRPWRARLGSAKSGRDHVVVSHTRASLALFGLGSRVGLERVWVPQSRAR